MLLVIVLVQLDGEDYIKWAEYFGREMYLKGKMDVLGKIGTKSEKKYKYEVCDIVRSPRGRIGEIQKVNATMLLGSNKMKPEHYDYWVYFGAAIEGGYKESELKIVNLSKEKKEEYHQAFRYGKLAYL